MGTYTHEQAEQSIFMGHLVEERQLAENRIQAAVQDSRDMGMSWAQIAIALSTSTQAAWERYGLSPEEKATKRLLATHPAMTMEPLPGLPVTVNDVLTAQQALKDIG